LPLILKAAADGNASGNPDLKGLPRTFDQALKRSSLAFLEWRYRTKPDLFWYLARYPMYVQFQILKVRPEWKNRPPKAFAAKSGRPA
jgi:hypothetical protein